MAAKLSRGSSLLEYMRRYYPLYYAKYVIVLEVWSLSENMRLPIGFRRAPYSKGLTCQSRLPWSEVSCSGGYNL